MQSRTKKVSVGILGGKGMLGFDVAEHLRKEYVVKVIDKDTYEQARKKSYDVLINANGNSKRFWANEHPFEDFDASTRSVYKSLFDFKFKKYIYISSSDVYENHSQPLYTKEDRYIHFTKLSPYGFHKYMSEMIIKKYANDYLILRSSMILGSNLKKGPLYDAFHDIPLFVSLASKFQIITAKEIAAIIDVCIKKDSMNQTCNVGGKGAFAFSHIRNYVKKPITLSPHAQTQLYELDVTKLAAFYPLKTSEDYLKEFIYEYTKKEHYEAQTI